MDLGIKFWGGQVETYAAQSILNYHGITLESLSLQNNGDNSELIVNDFVDAREEIIDASIVAAGKKRGPEKITILYTRGETIMTF